MKRLKNVDDDKYEWSLTDEEIKSIKGFENASVEEVELIKHTLTLLSLALFENELKNK